MTTIFTHNPMRVHQLYPDNSGKVNTWIFVGDMLPSNVLNELKKIEMNGLTDKIKQSTILKQFYGPKWIRLFQYPHITRARSHGAAETASDEKVSDTVADTFDLSLLEQSADVLDSDFGFAKEAAELGNIKFSLEDVAGIFDTTKREATDVLSHVTEEEKKESSVADERKHAIHIVSENVSMFPEDSILEVKKKLYVQSGVPIFRQHLWIELANKVLPLHYSVVTGSREVGNKRNQDIIFPNMKKILQSKHFKEMIQGIPINMRAYSLKNEIKIEALDEFKLLQHYYYSYGITEYFMIDLNSFALNVDALKNDRYQLELLYYGFIMLYFPMMTLPVFVQWITSPGELKSYYPDLLPNKHTLIEQFKAEQEIFDIRYSLNDKSKYPELESAITYSAIAVTNYSYNEDAIFIRNLFDYFALDETVDACKCVIGQAYLSRGLKGGEATATGIGEKYVILNKTYNNTLPIQDEIPMNSIMFRLNVKTTRYMHILVLKNGSYRVFARWKEEDRYDFSDILTITKISLGEFIERINSGGSLIGDIKLSVPSHSNSRFAEINISMFYKKPLTEIEFASLKSQADYFVKAGIMIKAIQEKVYASSADYYFYKGMFQYDLKRLEHSLRILNYYEFLSEALVKQKWETLFAKTRSTKLIHRLSDVKMEITGVREQEFDTYFWIITTLFYMFEISNKKLFKAKRHLVTKSDVFHWPGGQAPKQYVQYLKSFDPLLYNFKKRSRELERGRKKSLEAIVKNVTKISKSKGRSSRTPTDKSMGKQDINIYSKLCQRPFQPKILTPDDYDHLSAEQKKKVIKYWNFTTQSEAYYACPNKKFPNLRFIVKKHPLDYCIPCCKKREVSSVSDVQKTCMENHIYVQEKRNITITSRYIMTYGKNIEPGRLSQLPENSLEPLFYESSSAHSAESGCSMSEGFYVYGSHQHTQSVTNIGYVLTLVHAMNLTLDDLIEKTIAFLRKFPEKFNMLLHGLILQYFKSASDFEKYVWMLSYKSKSILPAKEAPWNKIFIDIAKLFFNINTIHFIDIDGELKLNVPGSLRTPDEFLLPTHQNLIVIQKGNYFYPIYHLNTEIYFATKLINTKLFSNGSNIMFIITELLNKTFAYHLRLRSSGFNLDNLYKFLNNQKSKKVTYALVSCYINKANLCYGVELQVKNISKKEMMNVYVPIEESHYETLEQSQILFESVDRENYESIPFDIFEKFMHLYNQWVEHTNKTQQTTTELYPLQLKAWLLLHDAEQLHSDSKSMNSRIIGFIANELYFYCKSINKTDAETINKNYHSVLFDPSKINQLIDSGRSSAKPVKPVTDNNAILYKLFLYQLLLLEFMTYFNTKKNKGMRTQIKRILSQLVQTKVGSTKTVDYDIIIEQLASIIEHDSTNFASNQAPQDLVRIKNMLYEFIEESQQVHTKAARKQQIKAFYSRIDNTRFDFDNEKLNMLKSMSNHVELCDKLKHIAHKFVKFTSAKTISVGSVKLEFRNMYTSCQQTKKHNQEHCHDRRLLISKSNFDEFISILAMDIMNPIKSQWIFNEMILKRNFYFYKFIRRPNETIFITIGESAY